MITINSSNELATIGLYSMVVGPSGKRQEVKIHLGPFQKSLPEKVLDTNYFQEHSNYPHYVIMGESGVLHKKREGVLTLVSTTSSKYVPSRYASSPPCLYLIDETGKHRDIGNYQCPLGGSLEFSFEFGKDYYTHFRVVSSQSQALLVMRTYHRNEVVENRYYVKISDDKNHVWRWNDFSSFPVEQATSVTESNSIANKAIEEEWLPNGGSRVIDYHEYSRVSDDYYNVAIRRISRSISPPKNPDESNIIATLCQEAVENVDILNINSLMYIDEMMNWRQLLPPVKELRGIANPRNWPNIYLWLRYGVKLSITDTKKILTNLPQIISAIMKTSQRTQVLRARHSTTLTDGLHEWKTRYHMRILADTYPNALEPFGKLTSKLYALDLVPTWSNTWDMIPFSFVLDWFIPINETLEKIDYAGRLQTFKIHVVTSSQKSECIQKFDPVGNYRILGTVKNTYYKRHVSPRIPSRGLFDGLEGPGTPGVRRYIDGASLILQQTL